MVLVLDAKMPSSALICHREISEAELVETYPWTLTKNEFKVYYHLTFTCSVKNINLQKLVNTISYEMHD